MTRRLPEPGRGDGEQLPLLGEVGGEEDAEQDLRHLDRLELEAPDPDPEPGAVDGRPDGMGHEGEEQEDDAEDKEQVAVAVEVPRAADEDQGEHVGGHTTGRPRRLEGGVVLARAEVDAQDEDVADAVEQEGDGKDDGRGVGHEDAVGDVGDPAEHEHHDEQGHHVGRDLGRVAQDHQRVGGHDDDRRRDQQAEFGPAAGLHPAGPLASAAGTAGGGPLAREAYGTAPSSRGRRPPAACRHRTWRDWGRRYHDRRWAARRSSVDDRDPARRDRSIDADRSSGPSPVRPRTHGHPCRAPPWPHLARAGHRCRAGPAGMLPPTA